MRKRDRRNGAGQKERKKWRAAGAGRLGGRCPGCLVSAGVSSRTHLRWPTAASASRNHRDKGRISGAVHACAASLLLLNARKSRGMFFSGLSRQSGERGISLSAFFQRSDFSPLSLSAFFQRSGRTRAFSLSALSQRSGEPGQPSGGRAGEKAQAAIHLRRQAPELRASPAVRTACPSQTGAGVRSA